MISSFSPPVSFERNGMEGSQVVIGEIDRVRGPFNSQRIPDFMVVRLEERPDLPR
jgi:hypothetical protein